MQPVRHGLEKIIAQEKYDEPFRVIRNISTELDESFQYKVVNLLLPNLPNNLRGGVAFFRVRFMFTLAGELKQKVGSQNENSIM